MKKGGRVSGFTSRLQGCTESSHRHSVKAILRDWTRQVCVRKQLPTRNWKRDSWPGYFLQAAQLFKTARKSHALVNTFANTWEDMNAETISLLLYVTAVFGAAANSECITFSNITTLCNRVCVCIKEFGESYSSRLWSLIKAVSWVRWPVSEEHCYCMFTRALCGAPQLHFWILWPGSHSSNTNSLLP